MTVLTTVTVTLVPQQTSEAVGGSKRPGRAALDGLVGGAGDDRRRGVLHGDQPRAGVGLALAIGGQPGLGDEPRAGAIGLGPDQGGREG